MRLTGAGLAMLVMRLWLRQVREQLLQQKYSGQYNYAGYTDEFWFPLPIDFRFGCADWEFRGGADNQ